MTFDGEQYSVSDGMEYKYFSQIGDAAAEFIVQVAGFEKKS